MRKALIAAAVATALFAVGAFAASFAVQSEDTASGSNDVQSCASGAIVDFNESFDNANNNWNVASAVVTVTEVAGVDCNGGQLELVLQPTGGGAPLGGPFNANLVVAAGPPTVTKNVDTWTVTFTGVTGVPVTTLANAAVLIDGVQLSSTST
jgi:hypothetical protein